MSSLQRSIIFGLILGSLFATILALAICAVTPLASIATVGVFCVSFAGSLASFLGSEPQRANAAKLLTVTVN